MPKYKCKITSIVIEAEQFIPQVHVPDGVGHNAGWSYYFLEKTDTKSVTKVTPYDWVVTGVGGKQSLVKPDEFKANYEPVEGE